MSKCQTIAVVDDDETIRLALGDLLHACGYGSALFASAEDYLAYHDRASIGCILVDVIMPGMGGIELQVRLNADPPTPPLIFMTSNPDDKTRFAALAGGAFAFLAKPVEVNRLIDFMRLALDRRC